MRIDILTIFPEMFEGPFKHSIIKRAVDKDLVSINLLNIRDYATDKHRRVDDYQYGGGSGMLMTAQPLSKAIGASKKRLLKHSPKVIYLSAHGEP